MILSCPKPKYFFSGLPNLLPQKIILPLISFFSRVSYIWGSSTGTGNDWKNLPGTAQTDTTMFAFIYRIYHEDL
jgi:hypothetical protein